MTTQRLYKELKDVGIIGQKGVLDFTMAGITKRVNDNSVYGNVIQEWLKAFMKERNIPYRVGDNSKEPPDFYMGNNDSDNLLEVKCFTKSPNFDISNFMAYCHLLLNKPHHLNADYLVFKYAPLETGRGLKIENIWVKKVWELCGLSQDHVLKCNWKKRVLHNIRPVIWYSQSPKAVQAFSNYHEMLEAVNRLLATQQAGEAIYREWLPKVRRGFEKHLQTI